MKKVLVAIMLVLAMTVSVYAETEVETQWFDVNVVRIGVNAGSETVDIEITEVNKLFKKLWVTLEGGMQDEMMATAYMAISMRQPVSVELEVPTVPEGQELIIQDWVPLKSIYVKAPKTKKKDRPKEYIK